MEQQNNSQIMSVKDWVITILLSIIPLIGLIILLIWAFGNDGNKIRQNWAKGTLIVMLILIVLYFVIAFLFLGMFAAAAASGSYGGNY